MTATVEETSGQADRWQALAPCAAPALVLLAIVVPFLRYHEYSLLLPESLLLMGGAALTGTAVGAFSRLRPSTLGPVIMVVTLGVYILYRKEVIGALIRLAERMAEAIGFFGIALGVVSAMLFLAACLICWLLREHLATIVVVVFGTIVLSSVILPTKTGGEAVSSGALPAKLSDLPPVIHIVLDEHVGLAAMPPEIEGSAAAASAIKATYKEFAVYSRAYSRFAETQSSLGSLMNHARGEDVVELVEKHDYGYTLHESAWFDLLKAKGYAIKVYQTPWLDMCDEIEAVDACYTYPLHSPNAAQRSALSAGARLRVLLGGLGLWRSTPLPSAIAASEAFDRFEADLAQAPRGVAYFVHLMLPHYDYLYRSDCSLADPADWQTQPGHLEDAVGRAARRSAYKLYMAQVLCTDRIVRTFLETLQRMGIDDEATIVVHGDHGSRIGQISADAPAHIFSDQDLLDYFATFLAIKTPSTAPGVWEEPVLLQHIFAQAFLGGAAESSQIGQVLLHEDADVFAARTLRWPGISDNKPAATGNLSSLGQASTSKASAR